MLDVIASQHLITAHDVAFDNGVGSSLVMGLETCGGVATMEA